LDKYADEGIYNIEDIAVLKILDISIYSYFTPFFGGTPKNLTGSFSGGIKMTLLLF
jgi:hypothetical protein